MKRLDLDRKSIDVNEFKKRTALRSDVSKLIKEDVIVYCNGQPVILYKKIEDETNHLRWAVKNIKYGTGKRTRGLVSTSSIFGYRPRLEMRQDYCSSTAMARTYPKQHHVITDYAKNIVRFYEEYFPDKYLMHKQMVQEKVMDDWTIGGTPFTSGIVNKNNQLKYHFDSGNFSGVLSNMIVFKRDTKGGYLVIPEFDIALEVADNTLTIFNGQDILHGVSPIENQNDHAYRYSIVYYSLKRMWQCEPINDEIARIRKRKTEREKNRIDPEHIKKLQKRKEEFAKENEMDKKRANKNDKN